MSKGRPSSVPSAVALFLLLVVAYACAPLSVAIAGRPSSASSSPSRGAPYRPPSNTAPASHTIHSAHGLAAAAADVLARRSFPSTLTQSSRPSRRLLQASEWAPLVIPLNAANQSKGNDFLEASTFVFNHLSRTSSGFVLFPYAFALGNSSNAPEYPQGAFVSTVGDAAVDGALPSSTSASAFQYAMSVQSLLLSSAAAGSQAQAVYDSSIAIFISYGVLPGDPSNTVRMLTNEAPNVCQALYGAIAGKWLQCWNSGQWLTYLAGSGTHEASSIVYVTAQDLASGLLFTTTSPSVPRFGSLIFTDIYFGSAPVVLANLTGTAQAAQAVQAFVQAGGTIISSGKGALLVQGLGLLPSASGGAAVTGVFDGSSELVSVSGYNAVPTTGCEQEGYGAALTAMDFSHRTLCFSLGTGQAGSIFTALVSSPPTNATALATTSLTVVSSFNVAQASLLIRDSTGVSTPVSANGVVPHVLYAALGQGELIINLGNAPVVSSSYPWLYNALFLSNSRPVTIESAFPSGEAPVIPALEQVAVSLLVQVANLYNEPLNAALVLVWPVNGVTITGAPAGCVSPVTPIALSAPATGLNATGVLSCLAPGSALAPLSAWSGNFTVFIQQVTVTQALTNIVLLHPQVSYTRQSGQAQTVDMPLTVSAYMAAQVVGDYNADPTGFYPLPGSGQFVDNVLTAENKQATTAFYYQHVAIVPLITPLVDLSLQSQVVRYLNFDYSYYQQASNGVAGYVYPQPQGGFSASNPAPHDYLDYVLLNVRGDSLAANWDEPILATKLVRNGTFPNYPPTGDSGVANISLAQYDVSNNNEYIVVQQTAFGDATNYFTYPSPRLLAFLDTTQPQAFRTYNTSASFPPGASSFPLWMMNPSRTALRQQLGFGSNSIYFYPPVANQMGYPLPAGITNPNAVLSLDRYNDSSAACKTGTFRGSAATKTVVGYYNSADVSSSYSPPGMLAHEYSNGLSAWCQKQSAPVNLSALSAASNGSSAMTHYIVVLNSNADITTGDDVMYMMADPAAPGEWYYAPSTLTGLKRYGDYPELRIKYVYVATFDLPPAISYRGGLLSFQLPSGWGWAAGVDPIANEFITWAADGISFTATTWTASTGVITGKFYRGELPDETSGAPSQLQINLEDLVYTPATAPSTFSATATLQQLVYDLSSPPTFETFTAVPLYTQKVPFLKLLALRLPAVKLSFQYSRTPSSSTPLSPSSLLNPFAGKSANLSYLLGYEDDTPFVRYGVYTQELMAHRTVYGSQQINPVTDTGLVTVSGGFSYITNLGQSSIPFRQYLTTGAGQLIPSTPTTGRFSWQDLWGRTLVEPVRSLFVDAAPLPGPLRNFQMTTTFELLNPTTGARQLQWHSDDTLTVRVQMKLLNNYQKWWVLTNSKQNELLFTAGASYPSTNFISGATSYPNQVTAALAASNTSYINYGYLAQYGTSLSSGSVWLSGQQLSAAQEQLVARAAYCVSNYSASCDYIGTLPVPSRLPNGTNVSPPSTWWNYASDVDAYWPAGYIAPDMWALTADTYDCNVFDYGYNYQFDNRLPSLDTGLLAPQNIVTFPIYAGAGYAMSYAPTITHPKFPGYAGWWSDQLQNKDDTVLAGQSISQNVSVGGQDLTLNMGWLDVTSLTAASPAATTTLQQNVNEALSNIYTCLFNRKRVATHAANPRVSNPANVVQNNVVPVDPTLTKTDKRLTQFACSGSNSVQYTPQTISQYDNYLQTSSASNYLYFAANLRGGALEDINVLYNLAPISTVQQEGTTTVQEGGEFVYWNPSLGPNAFETVSDPVSNVNAMRTDLTWTEALYPAVATTFYSTQFQLLTLTDPAEVNNQWLLGTSDQQYGFGDAAVRTFVGGTSGTSCIVEPGGSTYVEIDFFNNAGFDWEMLQGAIWSVATGQTAFNAIDLQSNIAPVIQAPTAYNFLNVQVPPALAPYLTIAPSQANAGQAPLEFDFTTNNVATIRDGFQGSYFYRIGVSSALPASLLGRMYQLSVSLNQSFFQSLPGYNDPTGVHDYTLSIPPINIGFPYPNGSQWAGQTYYVNGRAQNLTFHHLVDTAFTPVGAVTLSAADVVHLEALSAQGALSPSQATAFWASLNNSWNVAVPYTVTPQSGALNLLNFNFTAVSPTGAFPIPQSLLLGPDPAQVYLLLNTFAAQLQPVYANRVTQSSTVYFNDWMNVTKTAAVKNSLSVYAQGPYLTLSYKLALLDNNLNALSDQQLHCGDSGALRMTLTVQNIGTAYAYDVSMSALLNNTRLNASLPQPSNYGLNLTLASHGATVAVGVTTTEVLEAGGLLSAVMLLSYSVPIGVNGTCPSTVVFATGANSDFSFFPTGELTVQQNISTAYIANVTTLPRLTVNVNVTQSPINASTFLIAASAPNLPLSTVLTYLNTTAFPTVSSSSWAFAYQVDAVIQMLNAFGNATVTKTVALATVFASNGLRVNVTVPGNWESVSFQVVLGVSSVLGSLDAINTNPGQYFVAAQPSNTVVFSRGSTSSSSSSSHTTLIVEIVIPVVVGLALLLLVCFACLARRRGQGKDKSAAYAQGHRTLPPTSSAEESMVPEVQLQSVSTSPVLTHKLPPPLLMTGVSGVSVVQLAPGEMERRRAANEEASKRLRYSAPPLPASRPSLPAAPVADAPPLPESRPSLPLQQRASAPPLPSGPPRLSSQPAGEDWNDTADQFEGEATLVHVSER